jgi:hypothetical protein
MKLSLKSMVIAGALFKGIGFLFVSLLNVVLRPYGGAYRAMLATLYPGTIRPAAWRASSSELFTPCLPARLPALFSARFIISLQRESRILSAFSWAFDKADLPITSQCGSTW